MATGKSLLAGCADLLVPSIDLNRMCCQHVFLIILCPSAARQSVIPAVDPDAVLWIPALLVIHAVRELVLERDIFCVESLSQSVTQIDAVILGSNFP